MTDTDLLVRIDAVEPRTKAAKLRRLMPAIEAKLAGGASAADVVAALKQGGLALTMGTFRNYLARHRRQRASSPVASWPTVGPNGCSAALPPPPASTPTAAMGRGAPPAVQRLHEVMHPDPIAQTDDMARYERLGKTLSRKSRQPG